MYNSVVNLAGLWDNGVLSFASSSSPTAP